MIDDSFGDEAIAELNILWVYKIRHQVHVGYVTSAVASVCGWHYWVPMGFDGFHWSSMSCDITIILYVLSLRLSCECFFGTRARLNSRIFSRELSFASHAKKTFTEHRAIKWETSDVTVTFQGCFWASLGPKTLAEITVTSQVSHLIERCEVIVVTKYIGSRVVGKLYRVIET